VEVSEFFIKLLVVLLSAKLFAEIFNRLSIHSVLGEVVAGLIIGPSALGLVSPDATLHLIAEIGILLLLFEVGLEMDIGQLVKEGVWSTLVAVTGVVVPGVFGFYVLSLVWDGDDTFTLRGRHNRSHKHRHHSTSAEGFALA